MVQLKHQALLRAALIGLLVALGMGCGKKPYIYLDYRLPPATDSLRGRTVFVETNDHRSDKEIFNPRAQKAFENFTGLFSLSLVDSHDERTLKGAYPLSMLFETAMKERLKGLEISIAEARSTDTPILKIDLNQFRVNLVGQKWIADISYEVSLTRDNRTISREVVTGSAERLKLVGRGGAEKIMGEMFTEMINRLNVRRLFQQANL